MIDKELLLFPTADGKPDVRTVVDLYDEARVFNNNFKLDDTVQANNDFYVGRQWEGVETNGLPHPVFNIIKRVVGYIVSVINSDKISTYASRQPSAGTQEQEYDQRMVDVVNAELKSLHERVEFPAMAREFTRNAAIDGDACIYSWWDPDVHTGLRNGDVEVMGAIKKEIIENTRVFFGNPSDRHVEGQPWIMITSRELVRNVRKRAKENGCEDWRNICTDEDQRQGRKAPYQITNNKVTTMLLLWMDDETETCWCYECTSTAEVKKPTDLGYHQYPLVWMNWDYVRDSYHGQALVTGLIPNQVSQNRLWAMAEVQAMKGAWGKTIVDSTRIKHVDNKVGAVIAVNGGDVNTAIKQIDGIPLNPQIFQLLQLQQEQTEQSLGATSVALGDTRPDNTSAIVALTRSSQTPHEITKKNLYDCLKQDDMISLDIMSVCYGKRNLLLKPLQKEADAYRFIGAEPPESVNVEFDFSVLKTYEFTLKLDVGASTYWSETQATQTLDNLLINGQILLSEYLERIPDDTVDKKAELIEAAKKREAAQNPMNVPMPPEEQMIAQGEFNGSAQPPVQVPTGQGNGALQRAIAKTGEIPDNVNV